MTVGAEDPRVGALIGIAPPVDRYDFDTVAASTKHKFIIHGEADELIPLSRAREFYARCRDPKELVEIDRATHLFEGQTAEVGDALEALLEDFSCQGLS
jgi:alpha/beta superfamily hydrolase